MTKPMRQRKDDRLMHSGATAAEIRCDLATGPFDRLCREMDRKWGQDRLPELVAPETAARWGMALANLNAAIASQDEAMVIAREAIQAAHDGMAEAGISIRMPNLSIPTITGGKLVTGTLNGGGPEISVANMNGDVTLRQLEKK